VPLHQDAVRKLPCAAKLSDLNAKVFTNTVKGIGQLSVRLRDAEVLVLIRERTRFPKQLLEKLPKLRLISQTGRVGEHIDIKACTQTAMPDLALTACNRLIDAGGTKGFELHLALLGIFIIRQTQQRFVRGKGIDLAIGAPHQQGRMPRTGKGQFTVRTDKRTTRGHKNAAPEDLAELPIHGAQDDAGLLLRFAGPPEKLGGKMLIELIIRETVTCYNGVAAPHDWGKGCGECPACDLRAKGYAKYRGA